MKKSLEIKIFPYFMIFPAVFIFALFLFYPAVNGLIVALHRWDGLGPMHFIGLDNFTRMFGDRHFVRALTRTLFFTVTAVPAIYVSALLLALLLTQKIKGISFFRAAFFWPTMVSAIIVGLTWRFILGESFGLVNFFVTSAGFEPVRWMTNPNMAMFTVIMVTTWSLSGYYMVMLIAGLKSIDETYYEAAEIDGASFWKQFFYITLPLLRPMSLLVLVLSTVQVVRTFPLIVGLTQGGPAGATRFMVQMIQETGFGMQQMGYASAMAVVLFLILALMTAIQFRLNRGN
ncbi:MAG: sugar ABC transporter permease [Treponema sp.]|nr:sugar ABC transporter permease [Treponema sp.]